MTKTPNALSLFGDPGDLKGVIFSRLRDELVKQHADDFVKQRVPLLYPEIVDNLIAGITPNQTSSDDILSLLSVLQIEVEAILPLWPPLKPETQAIWMDQMKSTSFGGVAYGDGDTRDAITGEQADAKTYELELFLRFEALRGLFDNAAVSAS